MKKILKTRKDEIVNNVGGEDEFKKLQKVKLLKLMELEIQQLLEYWSLSQTLKIINSELELKISKTVFYEFCKKNIKKYEKIELEKNQKTYKGVSQKRDTKKELILDEDELNAVAMFGSSSKNQLKD